MDVKLLNWDRPNMVATISINDSETRYTIRVGSECNTEELVSDFLKLRAGQILAEQEQDENSNPDMSDYLNEVL